VTKQFYLIHDKFENMFKLNYAAGTRDVYSTYHFDNIFVLEKPISWFNMNGNFTDFVDPDRNLLFEMEYDPTKD